MSVVIDVCVIFFG